MGAKAHRIKVARKVDYSRKIELRSSKKNSRGEKKNYCGEKKNYRGEKKIYCGEKKIYCGEKNNARHDAFNGHNKIIYQTNVNASKTHNLYTKDPLADGL